MIVFAEALALLVGTVTTTCLLLTLTVISTSRLRQRLASLGSGRALDLEM